MLIPKMYRTGVKLTGVLVLGCLAARSGQAQGAPTQADSTAPWSASQSGWKGRLVIGEFMTGDFCGFCQGHDNTYDEFLRRYPRTAFVSLAYHGALGLPITDRTDPLPLAGRLYTWNYVAAKVANVPPKQAWANWLDGNIYLEGVNDQVQVIDSELKRPPEAFLQVQTRVKGGSIVARVKVDSVIGKHPKTYLHIVVVEDTVNLVGNGEYAFLPRQVHHMVVRAFAHTDKVTMALPLKAPGTVEYTFDMAAIQARFLGYHNGGIDKMVHWGDNDGKEFTSGPWNPGVKAATERQLARFPDERDWRMDPLRLHVVAFVQDAQTAEVLQAVMANLDPDQAKRLLPPKVQPTLVLKTEKDSALAKSWGYKELQY